MCFICHRDLSTFNLLPIQENLQDLNVKVQNLLEVIRNVKRFYQVNANFILIVSIYTLYQY